MNTPSHPIRVLLLETDNHLSAPVHNILHSRSTLKLFRFFAVTTPAEAFQEIEKEPVDILLLEVDPTDEADLGTLTRLQQHSPHTPLVALVEDRHQTEALALLPKGVQGYLVSSQITEETLPAFLLRTIERHTAQKAIRESEERFRLMIENASDVILMLDKTGVISYAGPSTKRILDYKPADLTNRNALDFIHRDDRRNFLDQFEKAFESGDTLAAVQFRFKRPDECWVHLEGEGRIAPDTTGQAVCILNSHDISRRVKLEEELRSLSLRDELTGLHNRRSFVTVLEQQLKQAHRSQRKGIFLLFIDLDGFKGINDTFGHKEGDRVLIEAARLLKNCFRDADLVARLGGDEFVVFLADSKEDTRVESLEKRLADDVAAWNELEKRPYKLAMSVGVLHHDLREACSTEELLRRADELMYEHKREKKRLLAIAAGSPQN